MKPGTKKMMKNIIFFIAVLVLTYLVIFSKINLKEIFESLKNSSLIFVFIAIICAANNIFFEAINLKRNFRILGDKVKFLACLKYATIGFFYSSITPAATGGQPMQLYAMTKDKLKLAHGVSALFMPYICYMISAVSLAVFGLIYNYNYIKEISFFKYLIYIGLIANGTITAFVMLAIFAKKTSYSVLNFVVSIIQVFSKAKALKFQKKVSEQINEWSKSSKKIISHKFATLKTFLISFLQVVSIHSVPYFIFYALGYQTYTYFEMVLLQAVIFISVSAIPLPGTIGVSETGFAIMYKRLFPVTIVETTMVLSRGVSFYLLVIISGVALLIVRLKKHRN